MRVLLRRVAAVVPLVVLLASGLAAVPTGASGARFGPWRLLPQTVSAARDYGPIACVGVARCWVPFESPRGGGAGVLATADGGARWSPQRLAGPASFLSGISCTSIEDCWVVGNSGRLGGRTAGVAFTTTDGGRSWRKLTLPGAVGPGVQHQLFGIACRSPQWCAAIGVGTVPGSSGAGCGPGCTQLQAPPSLPGLLALVTADGGRTWAVSAVPIRSGAQLNAISCGATGACATVGFGFADCRSTKQGRSACLPAGTAAGSRATGAHWVAEPVGGGIFNLYGVSCPTASQCFATGSSGNDVQGHGVILHTSDAGARWARQTPAPGSNSLTAVSCPTPRWCAAVGGLGSATHVTPTVETTSDAGARWSAGPLPGGLSQVVFVTCPAPGRCLAKGIEGYGRSERFVLLAS